MNHKQSVLLKSCIGYIALIMLANIICLTQPSQSKPIQPADMSCSFQTNSIEFPRLPDNGTPVGRRRGGTSRNDCPPSDITLIMSWQL